MREKVPQSKNWYAIFTKPRSEKKVYQRFTNENIESFLPLVKTVRQWSDRKKMVELPLIPSYVFIHSSEVDLYKSLMIPGAVNVLRFLGKPAVINDIEIDNLKILCNSKEEIGISNCVEIEKGDDVEVIRGPFMGLMATCIQNKNKHRVFVNIDSLGSCFNVNIPISFLRKTSEKIKISA